MPTHLALLRAGEALLAHMDREAPTTPLLENDRSQRSDRSCMGLLSNV